MALASPLTGGLPSHGKARPPGRSCPRKRAVFDFLLSRLRRRRHHYKVSKLFHAGELEVQRLAGVSDDAQAVGRGLNHVISPSAARFLAGQRIAVVSSVGEDRRVWASLLTGSKGFARAVDPELLWLEAQPHASDPLARNVHSPGLAGVLVIDLSTRQRMRFNGRGVLLNEGLFVTVSQVYGNCPKYIQRRREEPDRPGDVAESTVTTQSLLPNQRTWIETTDTFFIASLHPMAGADASHRGGHPGFVTVEAANRISFPDYPGNAMFNTLGNLLVNPRAGLLFVDFMTGDVLQLTGRARLDAGDRRVTFDVDECRETGKATPLRLRFVEYSRSNPPLSSSHP